MKRSRYIRFGCWPKNEHSHNYVTGEDEVGVSVFDAVCHDKRWNIAVEKVVEPEVLADTLMAQLRLMCEKTTQVFLVEGDLVGEGNDLEPLLRNLRHVEQLDPACVSCTYLGLHALQDWCDDPVAASQRAGEAIVEADRQRWLKRHSKR